MREQSVAGWEEFQEQVGQLRARQQSSDREVSPLLFRGQRRAEWPLETALERTSGGKHMRYIDYYRHISVIRPEVEVFTERAWDIQSYSEVRDLSKDYDSFRLKMFFGEYPAHAYMAHRSPNVAAYFAFRDVPHDDQSVAIFVLSEASSKMGSSRVPMIYRLGPNVKTHRRHFLQQSEYTMCLEFESGEWRFAQHESVPPWPGGTLDESYNFDLRKYVIPVADRLKVLRQLDEYNLNAFSLFGSEESLMDTLALKRFELPQSRPRETTACALQLELTALTGSNEHQSLHGS